MVTAKGNAPVSVFGLPASCLHCGGKLHLVNTSTNCSLAVGIMECDDCRRSYEVTCRMQPMVAERSVRRRMARVS
jgi:hypothetical protein